MAKILGFPLTKKADDRAIAETLERITDVLVRVARDLDACKSPEECKRLIDRLTQCAAELRYIALNARGFRL